MPTLRILKRELENFSPALILADCGEMDGHGPKTKYDIKCTCLSHPLGRWSPEGSQAWTTLLGESPSVAAY